MKSVSCVLIEATEISDHVLIFNLLIMGRTDFSYPSFTAVKLNTVSIALQRKYDTVFKRIEKT